MPSQLQGNQIFSKLENNKHSFYVQTTKGKLINKFVKTGKKMHCDVEFDDMNSSDTVLFIENMEKHCKQLIINKKSQWFKSDVTDDEIEYAFLSCFKLYKGKYRMRVNVEYNQETSQPLIKIFDERLNDVKVEDIKENTDCIYIFEIVGVRFNEKFQIDVNLKQMMILDDENEKFNQCLIQPASTQNNNISKKIEPVIAPKKQIQNEIMEIPTVETTDDLFSFVNDNTSSKNNLTDKTKEMKEIKKDNKAEIKEDIINEIKNVKKEINEPKLFDNMDDLEEFELNPNMEINMAKYLEQKQNIIKEIMKAKQMRDDYLIEAEDDDLDVFIVDFDENAN
jgi:hypothetical protein